MNGVVQNVQVIHISSNINIAIFMRHSLYLLGLGSPDVESKSRRPSSRTGKKSGALSDYDGPVFHVDLIKAKNLMKTDMIGKSDPYAVLKYGNQKDKTPVAKNTQNPEWNHSSDFETGLGDDTDLV